MICNGEELHKQESGLRDPMSDCEAFGHRIPETGRPYFGFFVVSVDAGAAAFGFAFDVSAAAFGFGFAA